MIQLFNRSGRRMVNINRNTMQCIMFNPLCHCQSPCTYQRLGYCLQWLNAVSSVRKGDQITMLWRHAFQYAKSFGPTSCRCTHWSWNFGPAIYKTTEIIPSTFQKLIRTSYCNFGILICILYHLHRFYFWIRLKLVTSNISKNHVS